MSFFPSSADSSSEEEEKSRPVIVVPKKRKYEEKEIEESSLKARSSSDEEELQVSLSSHPMKRKAEPAWKSSSAKRPTFSEPTGNLSSESSNDDERDTDGGSSSFSSPPHIKNSMPFFGSPEAEPFSNAVESKGLVMNNVAMKMMANMGYQKGKGLGKFGQGRTEIIEASKQRGRRGLGLRLKGLEPCDIKWDFEKEHISVEENVMWMPACDLEPPNIKELREWMKEGDKILEIKHETEFCDPDVLRNVLSCKDVFDELEPEEMRKARTRSNPYETIRGVFFQNRAAMKMANMDAVFDFMFTSPKDENGHPTVKSSELLYFADICAGPGGFSEYVLWRKKWHCKGFGFTLRGPNDFKLEEFYAGPPETFEPHYGVNGLSGDGNIYVSDNLRAFKRFVLENTDGKGVHFVMADGGFSVEGEENLQEILSKRLYLCQFLCALSILRIGGHFVCKVFDMFTPFSVGLLYLLYRSFQMVCVHKPNTSRPANSERYVICKWKREGSKDVQDYMYEVNCRLDRLSLSKTEDIVEVVPLQMLKEDLPFYDYVVDSNNLLGEWQVISLAKIKAFAQDSELREVRQTELRKESLEKWQIPEKMRSNPTRTEPALKFKELLKNEELDYIGFRPDTLDEKSLKQIGSVYDYRCIVSAVEKDNRSERAFILGQGRGHIFIYDGNRWTKIKQELTLELPVDTLLYAEIVQELKGEGKAQRKINALHIIDALFLGGEDVRDKHFTERISLAQLLVKAVSKPSRPDYTPIRVKEVYKLENAEQIFERIDMKTVKGSGNLHRLCYKMDNDRHFLPTGLLLMKAEEDPWTIAFSKTSQRKYHFNKKTNRSSFDCPGGSVANFRSTFTKRMFWAWEPGVQLLDGHQAQEGKIHRRTFLEFVSKRLR